MNFYRTLFVFSIACILLTSCATVPPKVIVKDGFRVSNHRLFRNSDQFTLQAVYESGLCAKGAALKYMVPAMAHVAEVGGNTIAFDLCGFENNGMKLSRDSVDTIATYAKRAKNQHRSEEQHV